MAIIVSFTNAVNLDFILAGDAPDYKTAVFSVPENPPDPIAFINQWIIDNQAAVDAALASGELPDTETRRRVLAIDEFILKAQNELDYLDVTIPAIPAMTVTEVRDVVERMARENRAVIRALIYLARDLER